MFNSYSNSGGNHANGISRSVLQHHLQQKQLQQQQQQQQLSIQLQLRQQQQQRQLRSQLPDNSLSVSKQNLDRSISERQQNLLEHMRSNDFEQMAKNLKESIEIKRRLESIKNEQQAEANMLRAELQLKAAAIQQQGTKAIHGGGNSSVLPTKRREDERTKPDLSTLAETAVAVATGSVSRRNSIGIGNGNGGVGEIGNHAKIGGSGASNERDNQMEQFFERRFSNTGLIGNRIDGLIPSRATTTGLMEKTAKPSPRALSNDGITFASSTANSATMDALRRESKGPSSQKLHLENTFKRSLEEIPTGNSTVTPSWYQKASSLDSSAAVSNEQRLQMLRRNSLPPSTSELVQASSLKRRRLLEQKIKEVRDLGIGDAMEQIRKLDTNMKLGALHRPGVPASRPAQLMAKMASAGTNNRYPSAPFSVLPQERRSSLASISSLSQERRSSLASISSLSQERRSSLASTSSFPLERRPSLASSVASAPAGTGTNPGMHNRFGSLASNGLRRATVSGRGSLDERAIVLHKLNRLGGGFPMPKVAKRASEGSVVGSKNRIFPIEITPEFNKDIVDLDGSENASKIETDQKEEQIDDRVKYLGKIGGFPMPSLYKNKSVTMDRSRYDDSIPPTEVQSYGIRNSISTHIKNTVNNKSASAPRPPALDGYKQIWRDIRVVVGDDPEVDESLRKEVFARKLHRGEILGKRDDGIAATGNTNGTSDLQTYRQRLSELSHDSNNDDSLDNSSHIQEHPDADLEESIVI